MDIREATELYVGPVEDEVIIPKDSVLVLGLAS